MTYIPDTRDPIERRPFSKENEPNAYYEGLLDEKDKWAMAHYDYGVCDVINALDNFDVACEMAQEYLGDECIPEKQIDFLQNEKVIEFIKAALLCYVENQRDEMVVAKLDNADEEVYDPAFEAMEKDFKSMSEEEFYKKYKRREYNEYGAYDQEEEEE